MSSDRKIVQRFEFPITSRGKSRARVIISALRKLVKDEHLSANRRLYAVQLLCYLEGLTETAPVAAPIVTPTTIPVNAAQSMASAMVNLNDEEAALAREALLQLLEENEEL